MLHFTDKQEKIVLHTLDETRHLLDDIQEKLVKKDGLLRLYKERQDRMIALVESWFT